MGAAAAAGTSVGTLAASVEHAFGLPPGAGGDGAVPVRRAAAWGTSATNVKETAGSTQSAYLARDPIWLTSPVKAGEEIEFAYPLWTNERISGVCQEVLIEEANDFQFAMEYPFTDSATVSADLGRRIEGKANGRKTYSYVPGQGSDIMMVFKVTAPADIPAGVPVGVLLLQDNVAGRTGAVVNKRIARICGSSTFMGRKGGSYNVASGTGGALGADLTMTRTAFTANSPLQTGSAGGLMLPGAVRIAVPSTTSSVYVDDNSIGQGSNEGAGESSAAGIDYGDVGGDAYGNTGYAMRTCQKLGIGGTNGSRGADSISNHLSAGFSRRLAFAAWCGATSYIGMNMHNDALNQAPAQAWAPGATYAPDDVVISGGRGYLCLAAGSGTVAPAGTALSGIASGTAQWGYLDEVDITAGKASSLGITYLGKISAYVRAIKAAIPGVNVVMPTSTPDATSAVVASAYAYDATSGELRATIDAATIAQLKVGDLIRIQLAAPSDAKVGTRGVTNWPIIRIEGDDVVIQRAAGLPAPTSETATVVTGWTRPDFQTPNAGFTAGNSIRSVTHRYLRRAPSVAIPIDGVMDLARVTESGNPVTLETETGVFASFPADGAPLAFAISSDGGHLTSLGNDVAAAGLAADAALAAILRRTA
ncbi:MULTISPECIES: hypothetical protein [unclassified Aureimonas]|uniref:hypothetical protein n=1 Tax=unclassified Aureimonas TaxID=2615206 RepID=UPI0006FC4A25|nr:MULTISPECIES: hypothetical protein [unclassified Aureimonas]KQT55203.1 hypothetical protein ASG62_10205 [Aureimonas sp. Leaf427]KQT70993.1 hypothetical protein ASG54_20590 [Aureimonas sp. Leaf460]